MEPDHSSNVVRRQGAYLPHWTRPGGTYSVTFRLDDALPLEKREELRWMRKQLDLTLDNLRTTNDPVAFAKEITLWRVYSSRADAFLDAGAGSCLMNDPRIADIVADALKFFDGDRYTLHAWAVMPNHVHVVFTPLHPHVLSTILKSWKGFTAREANRILGREGAVWQKESY